MCEYLGIGEEETFLIRFAVSALQAPIPKDWMVLKDKVRRLQQAGREGDREDRTRRGRGRGRCWRVNQRQTERTIMEGKEHGRRRERAKSRDG